MSTQTEPLHYFDELSGYKPEAIASYAPARPIDLPTRPAPAPMTPDEIEADRAGFAADLADAFEGLDRERAQHPERFTSDGKRVLHPTPVPDPETERQREYAAARGGSESAALYRLGIWSPDTSWDDDRPDPDDNDDYMAAEPLAVPEPERPATAPEPAKRPRAPRQRTPEQQAEQGRKVVAFSEALVAALADGPLSGRALTAKIHEAGVSLKSATERAVLADLVDLGVVTRDAHGSAFTFSLATSARTK